MQEKLQELLTLSQTMGDPAKDYVIVGEGNTSCRIDADSFWIKASGQRLGSIDETGFVAVHFDPILAMLDDHPGTLSEQKAIMQAARVDPESPLRPSVEVSFHAMLLKECDVAYVGHTHPVTVNQIMCSSRAEDFARNRLFPDEAVLCGPESVFVPYVDPGLPLALAIRDAVRQYMKQYDEAPKVILMANHGVIVLGQTPDEILNITAMCVKAAQIFVGACAVGEPVFMTREEIRHIYKRPDEIYRRQQFVIGSVPEDEDTPA